MRVVFVDTSFYVAAANPRDAFHAAATALSQQYRGRSVTTEYVLTEVANWFSRAADKPLFLQLLRLLRDDPETTVVVADHSLFDEGVALYSQRSDKDWSLTDCISLNVMREHGIADAFATDHHFEQAGYTIHLK